MVATHKCNVSYAINFAGANPARSIFIFNRQGLLDSYLAGGTVKKHNMTVVERSAYFAKKIERAIELIKTGKTLSQTAQILQVAPSFVARHTRGITERKKWGYFEHKPKVYNHWLDPNDEANIYKFWVPSPEEIEAECRRIRSGDLYIRSQSSGKHVTSFVSVASGPVSVDIFTREKTAEPFGVNGNRKRKKPSNRGPLSYRRQDLLGPSSRAATPEGVDPAECREDSSTSA